MQNIVSDTGHQPWPPSVIPVADPGAELRQCYDAVTQAIESVLCSGRYILGYEVDAFEREWAEYLGARTCIGVANGTDALALALKAVGVRPGDEVITVSHTAVATVVGIESVGAVPVFVDIDPSTRCLNPALIESMLSPKVRAIVPVHIYGQPADMVEILAVAKRHSLLIVEDCAQAHGAEIAGRKVGTFGQAAAFSFYPTKNLGAVGDAGAVVCNDEVIAEQVRALRQYGWRERYISDMVGTNSRLDELQAALLRVKLRQLDQRNRKRREIAERYLNALVSTGLVGPSTIPGTLHAMHLFVVSSDKRRELSEYLTQAGIATAWHYPQAVHQQPAYAGRIRGADKLPFTERFYERLLTIPCHPDLTDEQVSRVCERLTTWSERPAPKPEPQRYSTHGVTR